MLKSQERCQEIREETRSKILHDSMLYFAKNGFAGTKISDLAKHIGIGQGTLCLPGRKYGSSSQHSMK